METQEYWFSLFVLQNGMLQKKTKCAGAQEI
jgi:hypothetical protein